MKNMKYLKRFAALLIAAMLLAVSAAPALAATTFYDAGGVQGTEVTLTEELYIQNTDTSLPYIRYTLALLNASQPKDENDNDVSSDKFEGAPTVTANAEFDPSSYLHTTSGSNATYPKYATSQFKVNFSTVTFKEPGIYRYYFKKGWQTDDDSFTNMDGTDPVYTSSGHNGNLTNTRYDGTINYIDVYVTNVDGSNALSTPQYVISDSQESARNQLNKNFEDTYKAFHNALNIEKQVRGTMASKSQYFKFKIELTEGQPGAQYKVTGSYAPTTSITAYNATSYNNHAADLLNANAYVPATGEASKPGSWITLDNDGDYTGYVWLRDGERVTFEELSGNIKYSITEDAVTGYVTTVSNDNGYAPANGIIPAEVDNEDVTVKFVNTKTTPIAPTGINLQIAAPVFGILLAGLLIGIVLHGKRKENA